MVVIKGWSFGEVPLYLHLSFLSLKSYLLSTLHLIGTPNSTARVSLAQVAMSSTVSSNTKPLESNRELKIEMFSGRRQLQPDVTSSFVGYCTCSRLLPCRRGPVGGVKLVCLPLWRKHEYLTFISIRFVAFSNQNFADYRS